MLRHWLWEPFRAYWARKRLERMQYETAANLYREAGPERVEEDPDADDWRLLGLDSKQPDDHDRQTLRAKARHLADTNPYARNILTLYRNYVVGTGMRHEVSDAGMGEFETRGHGDADFETRRHGDGETRREDQLLAPPVAASPRLRVSEASPRRRVSASVVARVSELWQAFLTANDWHAGNRKDWEFCLRTWRDGECFLRLFRQPAWPPRVHFVDPEHVAPDPRTGLPSAGIETAPGNVEEPLAYFLLANDGFEDTETRGRGDTGIGPLRVAASPCLRVPSDRILHTKIGVDANVKRGVSIFLPVLESLKRFQGWLDVELIQRKVASSIVLVRKHTQNYPGGVASFADSVSKPGPLGTGLGDTTRRLKLQPGSIIDTQGFDLEFLSPNTHFEDASLLGRMILLSIAAGTGLPEFMLAADASNANYASTLVAEGPAVRHFAAWQAFFAGQWLKLFRMVLGEAVWLGLLDAAEADAVTLQITPPPLAVRNRHQEAQADAIYYDRGALSARELARRDAADPDRMQRERDAENQPT